MSELPDPKIFFGIAKGLFFNLGLLDVTFSRPLSQLHLQGFKRTKIPNFGLLGLQRLWFHGEGFLASGLSEVDRNIFLTTFLLSYWGLYRTGAEILRLLNVVKSFLIDHLEHQGNDLSNFQVHTLNIWFLGSEDEAEIHKKTILYQSQSRSFKKDNLSANRE